MLIDSHAHLGSKQFPPEEVPELIARARAVGVERIVNLPSDFSPDGLRATLALCASHPELSPVLGYHPHDAAKVTQHYLDELVALAKANTIHAIGEIGLDYYYKFSTPDEQRAAFLSQLEIATDLGQPIVVHCRDAYDELVEFFGVHRPRYGGVIHCYSGTKPQAHKLLDLGMHLSFTGVITYKKNDELREIVAEIPRDRYMMETDCPYLAPMPLRGKRNEPALVKHTAECAAELRGLTIEELGQETSATGMAFFKLPF